MTDPIVELVRNEVNGKRVYQRLKISGMPRTGSALIENQYKHALRHSKLFDMMNDTLEGILNKHQSNKNRRKELQVWAGELFRDGKRKAWGMGWNDLTEGRAKIDFSKAIIDAFKKLPKV